MTRKRATSPKRAPLKKGLRRHPLHRERLRPKDRHGPSLDMRPDRMNSWATWWLRPSSLLLYLILPLYLVLYNLPQMPIFESVSLKTLIYFNQDMFVYGLLLLGAFYLGSVLPLAPKTSRKITPQEIDLALDILGGLAVLGYIYMLLPVLLHPGVLVSALSSGGMTGLVESGTIDRGSAGVGSLQQLGLAYFAIYFFTRLNRGRDALRRRHHIAFYILAGLTFFRAMFLAQRLALIEAGVPFALYFVHSRIRKAGPFEAAVIGLFPIISFASVVLLFAGTEFFRSWSYHKDEFHFWDYVFGRLLTYYYTALNNGAIALQTSDWPTFSMINTFGWLYRLPVISDIMAGLVGAKYFLYLAVLDLYADPEFNNCSGLFPIIQDLGVPLAVIFYFGMGAWLSYAYRCFVIGAGWGAFYYPLIYLTTVEVLRIFYLGSSKLIIQVFLVWLISLVVRKIALPHVQHGLRARRMRAAKPGPDPGAVPATMIKAEPDTPAS